MNILVYMMSSSVAWSKAVSRASVMAGLSLGPWVPGSNVQRSRYSLAAR